MQFQLSGQHLEVTEALRAHATARLERLTRLDDKLISLVIVLSLDKLQHCAEGTLALGGATLHAKAATADMYASIDVVFDKLLCQLRKHRAKVGDKHQREGRQERMYG